MTISVCIAAFNGSKYIKDQISSIICQLAVDDEIVVSDDCSDDNTVLILESFNDSRIKIINNNANVGHVKNFERALSFAKNELIFLSDQDDLWLPGKVQTIVKLFLEDSELIFVHHSISLLDSEVGIVHPPFHILPNKDQYYLSYLFRQLVSPNIWGCATAFRRDILKILLPFPVHVYAHDHWLGIVVAGSRKRIKLLNNCYVLRRLHDNNRTPISGGNNFKIKLVNRLKLYYLTCVLTLRFFVIRF